MISSIEEYLSKLKKELSGCNPDIIQAALSDSEEHLREALSSAHKRLHDRPESSILQEIIENYGTPEEIAATYKEIEARKAAVSEKKKRIIPVGLVVFFSSLFTSVYFLGQGIILLNWQRFNGDGFGGLERNEIIFSWSSHFTPTWTDIWAILCLMLSITIGLLACYIWISHRKREFDLPIQIWLPSVIPFLAQGIALFCYWATRSAGHDRFESGTALLISILSLSLAFILLLIFIMARNKITLSIIRHFSHEKRKHIIISAFIITIIVVLACLLITKPWYHRGSILQGPITEQWIVLASDGTEIANAMTVDTLGNVYITGRSYVSGSNRGTDYSTIKYNNYGELMWSSHYNGPSSRNDEAQAIAIDNSGNVYVTGHSEGIYGTNCTTIKYDNNGNQLWIANYGGTSEGGTNLSSALVIDDSGNAYVAGCIEGSGSLDYVIIKYDSNGNELWVARYNCPASKDDWPKDIALDSQGNIYVTGYSNTSNINTDYTTIKYDNNGNQLWVANYDGYDSPESCWDEAQAIAVDNAGNVYVTGHSDGFVSGLEFVNYATIKYDSDGNHLWVASYDGPAHSDEIGYDHAEDIAVDNSGNVYVTGQSNSGNNNSDYTTIKYDSNGNQLWVARYDGPASDYDLASSITVDQSGNVYVTGTSQYKEGDSDAVTACYDNYGNEIWTASYNGSASKHDMAKNIIVDSDGNVYVSGYSNDDCLVIKYTSVAE